MIEYRRVEDDKTAAGPTYQGAVDVLRGCAAVVVVVVQPLRRKRSRMIQVGWQLQVSGHSRSLGLPCVQRNESLIGRRPSI